MKIQQDQIWTKAASQGQLSTMLNDFKSKQCQIQVISIYCMLKWFRLHQEKIAGKIIGFFSRAH